MMKKPRIRSASAQLIARMDAYIRQYDLRGPALAAAASDELDGSICRFEVEDLVRRRLLSIVRYERGAIDADSTCGSDWSVAMTPRAVQLFWPTRLTEKESPEQREVVRAESAAADALRERG